MAAPPDGTVSVTGARGPGKRQSLAPGDVIDRVYLIERLLGEGAHGTVFLVRHRGLGDARFALKVVRATDDDATALTREGRLAAKVRSAHVVKVTALGSLPRGAPYLVMEYVDGPTVDERLAGGELTADQALDCGRQLCLALEAAHHEGLIHGDVSLRNLFTTTLPDGRLHLQLGDFGLVRRARGDVATTVSVDLGTARGTPRFMAPEIIAGEKAVDPRSDLFSAGVVLYRLLTGAYPFDGATTREIFTAILRGQPVPLVERRPELAAIAPVVMRCLEVDPAARFADARALREALDAASAAAASGIAEPPRAEPTRGGRASRRRAWITGGGVVAMAVTGAWLVGRPDEARAIPPPSALACPATTGTAVEGQPDVAEALAGAVCARVAATLDVDWGGGRGATEVRTRAGREPAGDYVVGGTVDGHEVTGRGATPLAAALDAADRLAARFAPTPLTAEEVHRWGARDADSARAARTVWRRRTTIQLDDYETAPRAVLARDPTSPMMHLLLAEVDRDPARQAEARAAALANADRLPPARADALRGFLAVQAEPEAPDHGLALLRRAYSAEPDDLEIAVLHVRALVDAGRADDALAVIDRLVAREPRRAVLAAHHGHGLPQRTASELDYLLDRELAAAPTTRASAANISRLLASGRLDEARGVLDFARRLGLPEERLGTSAALLALVTGEPAAGGRGQLGDAKSWSRALGARVRLAELLVSGEARAAATLLTAQIAEARAVGNPAAAATWSGELLTLARRTGEPQLAPAALDEIERDLAAARLALASHARVATELALARARAGAPLATTRAALVAIDRALVDRAGGDATRLLAARLRTLPLVRAADGDAEAASRWHDAEGAWHLDRVMTAHDAGLALEAVGDRAGAEAAYRLAASAYAIERHPLEAVAARLRLVELLTAAGRADEATDFAAYADRVLAGADPGVRARLAARP